jgi:enamine deaminase RidA (YjgF/YER057c/UK114 family)
MFVTDIARWAEVIAVHGEVFGDIRPAATLVEVRALIDPSLLIEIEVDARRA